MAIEDGPLTDADIQDLKLKLKDLDRVDAEIRKAETAGLDMSQQKAQAKELRQKLMMLKNTYAPGR